MSMTYNEVVEYLTLDEPRAGSGERLDSDAVEHLERIFREGHSQLSVKAALALSIAGASGHHDLVRELAEDSRAIMRVAAARAAATLSSQPRDQLLARLLDDQDAGVQKEAILAAGRSPSDALRERLRTGHWHDQSLRTYADEVVARIGG